MRIESKGLIEKIMGLKGFRKGIRTKRLTEKRLEPKDLQKIKSKKESQRCKESFEIFRIGICK